MLIVEDSPIEPRAARDAAQELVDSAGLGRERGRGPGAARTAQSRRQPGSVRPRHPRLDAARHERLDAAARIRARDETRALPIIVISAYAGKEEEARCAELGVNVFLRKPITASSLFDAIVESQGVHVHTARRGLDAPLEREFDGVRALLAEDNEANQMVATELLGAPGDRAGRRG